MAAYYPRLSGAWRELPLAGAGFARAGERSEQSKQSQQSSQPGTLASLQQVDGVIAIGTDLLDSRRIQQAYQRHGQQLLERFLTPAEQQVFALRAEKNAELGVNYLAKRYCAKEALAKALGTGIAKGVGFQQLEILNDEQGAPVVNLYAGAAERLQALGGQQALISLSDEGELIQAFALIR